MIQENFLLTMSCQLHGNFRTTLKMCNLGSQIKHKLFWLCLFDKYVISGSAYQDINIIIRILHFDYNLAIVTVCIAVFRYNSKFTYISFSYGLKCKDVYQNLEICVCTHTRKMKLFGNNDNIT
jgi:hypothetical protein